MIRSRHRITTWMALLGYGLVASGLPLPLGGPLSGAAEAVAAKRLAGKDRSRPFPCMDKPCGCATAEQCFTNCCCNTPSQTLAWARTRGLEPALLADLARRATPEAPGAKVPASCCTARATGPSCCTAADDTCREGLVCSDDRSLAAEPTTMTGLATPAGDEESAAGFVVLRAMLACGGIVAQWCAAGAAPPPARIEVRFCLHCVDTLRVTDLVATCRADDLDVPPPRAA